MGLFSKKSCDICGANMGRITDKKLKDGGICKDCAKKLSIWFEDARQTTIQEVKDQIADREENRKKLDDFVTTYAFGDFGCILIDEEHRQFVGLMDTSDTFWGGSKKITSIDQIKDKNPDIIQFSQIVDVEIIETCNGKEEKKTEDGKQVSYDPKHMTYMTSFDVRIKVDHPYINALHIPLNTSVHIKCEEPRKVSGLKEITVAWLLDRPEARIEKAERVHDNPSFIDMIYDSPYKMPDYSFGFRCTLYNEKDIKKYKAYLLMANEIKEILTA